MPCRRGAGRFGRGSGSGGGRRKGNGRFVVDGGGVVMIMVAGLQRRRVCEYA